MRKASVRSLDYTIPRNNRELQLNVALSGSIGIIPYQEIIGNYSLSDRANVHWLIIPYQEIIGNYSSYLTLLFRDVIIPYQEIIGNYSVNPKYLEGV